MNNQVQIVIKAQDQASAVITQVQSGLNSVANSAQAAQIKMAMLGATVAAIGSTSLTKLSELTIVLGGVKNGIESALNYQVGEQTVFDIIKQKAEEALSETRSLSETIGAFKAPTVSFGRSFLNYGDSKFLDTIPERFDKVSQKMSGILVDKFQEISPRLTKVADKAISDIGLDTYINSTLPDPLRNAANVFGQDSAKALRLGVKSASALFDPLNPVTQQLRQGSAIGAFEKVLSSGLGGAFARTFITINKTIGAQFQALGEVYGKSITTGLEPAVLEGFGKIDNLLNGQLTSFIDNGLPVLSKALVKKIDVKGIVKNMGGNIVQGELLASAPVGNLIAPVTKALANIPGIGDGFTTSYTVDKVFEDLKAYEKSNEIVDKATGGVLFKAGAQLTELSGIADTIESYYIRKFQNIGKAAVQSLGGNLYVKITESVKAIIPAQVQEIFSILQEEYPEQFEKLQAEAIKRFQGMIGKIGGLASGIFGGKGGGQSSGKGGVVDGLLFLGKEVGVVEENKKLEKERFGRRVEKEVTSLQDEAVQVALDPQISPGDKQRLVDEINQKIADAPQTVQKQLDDQIAGIRQQVTSLQDQAIQIALDPTIDPKDKQQLIDEVNAVIEQAGNDLDSSPLRNAISTAIDALGAVLGDEAEGTLVGDFGKAYNKLNSFLENALSDGLKELGSTAGSSYRVGLLNGIAGAVAPALDEIDEFVLDAYEKIKAVPEKIAQPLEGASNAFGFLAGMNEPLALFETVRGGLGQAFEGISAIGQQITFFSSGLQTLQQLVSNGPFELLIGQNIRLKEQLLATQTSLAATNKVVNSITGQEITFNGGDPAAPIKALGAPVEEAIAKVRKYSLELSGVTSGQLIESFQIIAGQAGAINISLDQAAQLTKSFSGALGVVGIPLSMARQEINSILMGQIDQNSALAKSIGLTNEQVRLWKNQGKLYDNLVDRLKAFEAGNKEASRTVGGLFSNIQEIFEEIGRKAGEPLLEPIVTELEKVYNYFSKNLDAIASGVSDIAGKVFAGVMAVWQSIQNLLGASQGVFTGVSKYLFESLAGGLQALAKAINSTVDVLRPVISVFAQLFETIKPLSGPIIEMTLQLKALQLGVQGLGSGFGMLGNLLPGVGELLFGINARSLPLINMFPNLSNLVGGGAAGFLLLGQNMNAVPGLAGTIAGKMGPLGPLLVGMIPTVAGLGVQFAGLAKMFPPLEGALKGLFASNPTALLQGLSSFTATVPGLTGVSKAIDSLAKSTYESTKGMSLAQVVTEQFQNTAKTAGIELRNFALNMGVLAVGFVAAFYAVDNFILKNEALMGILKGIAEGFVSAAQAIGQLIQQNAVIAYMTPVVMALALNYTLLYNNAKALVGVQVAGWAFGAAAGFDKLAGFLEKLLFLDRAAPLGTFIPMLKSGTPIIAGMAAGASNAALGIRALTTAATEGTTAAANLLAANGKNVVTLQMLWGSLVANTQAMWTYVTATVSAAATNAKNFAVSLWGAITGLYAKAKAAVAAGIAMIFYGKATGGVSFSLKGLLVNLKSTVATMGTSMVAAAKGGITMLIGFATGATGAGAAFATLTTAMGTALAGIAALAAPIALIVAGLASIALFFQTERMKNSTQEMEQFGETTDQAFSSALSTAQLLKKAKDEQAYKTKNGIKLTEDEYKQNKKLMAQSQAQQNLLLSQISVLETAKKDAVSEEDKNAYDAQIASLQKALTLLKGFSTVSIAPKDLPRLGTIFEQLSSKAATAEEAIKNAAGDPEIFKQKGKELLEVTKEQLKLGQITESEARRRYASLANNVSADKDLQIGAQEAITEAFKSETQKQVEAKDIQLAQIESLAATGEITEVEAAKRTTEAKNAQLKLQLEEAERVHKKKMELLDEELKKTIANLTAQLNAKTAEAYKEPPGKKRDDKLAEANAIYQQIGAAQQAHETAKTEAERQGENERDKLKADQKKNAAEGNKRIQDAELKELEKVQKKAIDAAVGAENDRLIQKKQLLNKGQISQAEYDEAAAKSTVTRTKAELAAEDAKLKELEQKIKSAPDTKTRKELEEQIRASKLKTQDLTKNLLDGEQKAYESHINTIRAAIERDQTKANIDIEKSINAGTKSQVDADAARAAQTVQRLQKEIAAETRNKDKKLKLELELQQALGKSQEAQTAQKLAALDREFTQKNITTQKGINSGKVLEETAASDRAQQQVARLEKEIALTTRDKDKKLKLELELQQAIKSAQDANIAERLATLKRASLLEQAALQEKANQGLILDEAVATARAKAALTATQAELNLAKQGSTKYAELMVQRAEQVKALKDAEIAEKLAAIKKEQLQEEAALQDGINSGSVLEETAARSRSESELKATQAELNLTQKGTTKYYELLVQRGQKVKALRDAQVAEKLAAIDKEGIKEQIQLQKGINAGTVLEETAAKAQAEQRLTRIQEELKIQTNNAKRKLELEKEYYEAVKALQDAKIAEKQAANKRAQLVEEIGLQKAINQGLIYEEEANTKKAEMAIAATNSELALTRKNTTKYLELLKQREEQAASLKEAKKNERLAELNREQLAEQTGLQNSINQGLIREERANTIRAQQTVDRIKQELALETTNRTKILELKKQLAEAEKGLQDAQLAEYKAKLDQETQAFENKILKENQALQKQASLYDMLGKALENQSRLINARKDLANAETDYITGSIDLIAQSETSEYKKRQLAETTAAIKLRALEQQIEYDRMSLELEQRKNKLALEREIIQNRMAQADAAVESAKAKANIATLNADPKATAEQKEAAQLQLDASLMKQDNLKSEAQSLIERRGIEAELAQNEERKFAMSAQSRRDKAQFDLINTLPAGTKNAYMRAFREGLSQREFESSSRDLRRSGVATSRNLLKELYPDVKRGLRPNIMLEGYDPELGSLTEVLSGAEAKLARDDVQAKFDTKFGDTGFTVPNAYAPPAPELQLPTNIGDRLLNQKPQLDAAKQLSLAGKDIKRGTLQTPGQINLIRSNFDELNKNIGNLSSGGSRTFNVTVNFPGRNAEPVTKQELMASLGRAIAQAERGIA